MGKPDTRWQTSEMKCDACGHEWIAVHPVQAEYLACGCCGQFTPAPAAPLLEQEED
jgi:hypothetical protein